jgi:hypothetical protein
LGNLVGAWWKRGTLTRSAGCWLDEPAQASVCVFRGGSFAHRKDLLGKYLRNAKSTAEEGADQSVGGEQLLAGGVGHPA